MCTHTHTRTHRHTHKHKCKVTHLITERGPHSSQMSRNIRHSNFLHFGIPDFCDVILHHWLPEPVTQLTRHHTPVTPLYKPQNPLVFHLHLTIIEYVRIGKRVAQCNVVFVVAPNYKIYKRIQPLKTQFT